MLHVILWKWVQPNFRDSYTFKHVNIVAKMLREFTTIPMRVHCITDEPYGIDPPTEIHELWPDHNDVANATGRHLPSCYRRLRLFDHATQRKLGIETGERIASLDLDTIIVGELDTLWEKIEFSNAVYAGWGVRGTYHQMVFNGSFWSFKAGDHLQHIWSTFDPLISPRQTLSKGFLGSDQSWLSLNFAKRSDVLAIRYPDFASYPREVRRMGRIDRRAKIIFFHGSRKPWHPAERKQQPWIVKHWPGDNPHEPR